MANPPPLEIPAVLGFNSKSFDLNHIQQITPSGRGYLQALDRTTPMWVAEYQTPGLSDTAYDQAIAFLMRLEGAMGTFLAYDPRRPMPRAYQSYSLLSDPWTRSGYDTPVVIGFDYEYSQLSLEQLATGAIITAGDYISFFYDGIWYLFRSMTNAVANASGQAVIEVKPRPYLPEDFTSADVRYRKACCEMKVIGGYKENDTVDTTPSFSFRAVQFLNRSVPASVLDTDQIWRTDSGFFVSDENGNIIAF
jgi:hypothetical protein